MLPCHARSTKTPWVLERRPGEPQQRGMPEGGLIGAQPALPYGVRQGAAAAAAAAAGSGGSNNSSFNYFVLMEQGDTMTAFPVDMMYQFKQILK